LSSMSLLSRTQELHLHGPAELEEIIALHLKVASVTLSYPLHFHSLHGEGIIADTGKVEVYCFTVKHRIDCWGFLFKEKKKPRSVDAEKAKAFEIPAAFYEQLQQGIDYKTKKGTIISNEEVTIATPKPRSYAFCADTIFDPTLAEKVKGVDLLYHETTYLKDQEKKAFDRFHCTTVQAGEIAKLAGAGQLMIGHFSSKYETLDAFLSETKEVFENTVLAIEGTCYKI
jgi:ribonuclease Z